MRTNRGRKALRRGIAIGVVLQAIASAHAQQPASGEPDARATNGANGTNGVPAPATAPETKLPLTKDVVSGEAGGGGSSEGYADAVSNVAGVTSNNARGTANSSIMMRGIQLNLFTSYRLNGGLPTAGVISAPTENKAFIETLKGANALMFGIASPGGIVNMVPKRAGSRDVTSFALSGNSWGQLGGAADIGRRFGDNKQFGLRANASWTHFENGVSGASGHGEFASIGADWRATDRLKFQLDVEHYSRNVVEQGLIAVLPAVNGAIAVPAPPDPKKLLSGTWSVYTPKTDNIQLRGDYALSDNWSVMAEAGRSESSRSRFTNRIVNYNLATGDGTNRITVTRNQRYVNEFYRAELDGKFNTGWLRHDMTFGVSSSERFASQPVSTEFRQPQNIYNPIPQAAPAETGAPLVERPQISKDVGVYLYDTIDLSRQWKLLAGVRKTFYEADNTTPSGTIVNKRSRTWSPALGALYEVQPNFTVYASFMKGLEETGSAPVGTVNQFEILPPAEASQVELGFRTNFSQVHANVAYFNIRRANALTDPRSNVFLLDGNNTFQGVEGTFNIDINRAWSIYAAGQYLDAEQDPERNFDLKGKRPENTPRFTGSLSARYRPDGLRGVTFTGGLQYVGERYVNALNQGSIPGVTLYTAGANYSTRISGKRTTFQVTIDNLTNRRYWNSVSSGAYGAGMDRTLRLSAKIDL